jgi:hypothetical protein
MVSMETQGLVAIGIMLVATIAISIMIVLERRKYLDDDFDGGFSHDNRPRVITRIKANFIEEDNDYNP